MKHFFMSITLAAFLAGGMVSCKDKSKQKVEQETTYKPDQTTVNGTTTAPEISGDDQLRSKLPEATKDFPNVTTAVNNGEVTLTGTVERDRLPRLMQSVQALNPKKVNNQLTIK
ncbi:MAG: BON domain-containing protein [Sphingobacteriales bacterium]|nr:MAG: BON domain-containing protein [Sphingobacteriales bacterium]